MQVTKDLVHRLMYALNCGLPYGKGDGQLGSMCVMQAIAFINGEDCTNDQSECVHIKVRNINIVLNDSFDPPNHVTWDSPELNQARANAMRELAVCSLGSADHPLFSVEEFDKRWELQTSTKFQATVIRFVRSNPEYLCLLTTEVCSLFDLLDKASTCEEAHSLSSKISSYLASDFPMLYTHLTQEQRHELWKMRRDVVVDYLKEIQTPGSLFLAEIDAEPIDEPIVKTTHSHVGSL